MILLVIASFLLPLLYGYLDYCILVDADFISVVPKFEDTDSDCLLLFKKQKPTALTGFSHTFWAASNLIGYLPFFYYQVTFPQAKTLVLRC